MPPAQQAAPHSAGSHRPTCTGGLCTPSCALLTFPASLEPKPKPLACAGQQQQHLAATNGMPSVVPVYDKPLLPQLQQQQQQAGQQAGLANGNSNQRLTVSQHSELEMARRRAEKAAEGKRANASAARCSQLLDSNSPSHLHMAGSCVPCCTAPAFLQTRAQLSHGQTALDAPGAQGCAMLCTPVAGVSTHTSASATKLWLGPPRTPCCSLRLTPLNLSILLLTLSSLLARRAKRRASRAEGPVSVSVAEPTEASEDHDDDVLSQGGREDIEAKLATVEDEKEAKRLKR